MVNVRVAMKIESGGRRFGRPPACQIVARDFRFKTVCGCTARARNSSGGGGGGGDDDDGGGAQQR